MKKLLTLALLFMLTTSFVFAEDASTSSFDPNDAEFVFWAVGDPHVNTDLLFNKKVLSNAISDSLYGGDDGGESFDWDIIVATGDYTGKQQCPGQKDGEQYMSQISDIDPNYLYGVIGNHDGTEDNYWYETWIDPFGENTDTSLVSMEDRPYIPRGEWDHFSFEVGNILFLMLGDNNFPGDTPFGRGCKHGYPAGSYTKEAYDWWVEQIESNPDHIIVTVAHHALLETTAYTGLYEGGDEGLHGVHTWADDVGSSMIYAIDDITIDGYDENRDYVGERGYGFKDYLEENPGAIDVWLHGHTHANMYPGKSFNGRSDVEEVHDVLFVNSGALTVHHGGPQSPYSKIFYFDEDSNELYVRSYIHRDRNGWQEGFYDGDLVSFELPSSFDSGYLVSSLASGVSVMSLDGYEDYSVDRQYSVSETVFFESGAPIAGADYSYLSDLDLSDVSFDYSLEDAKSFVSLEGTYAASSIEGGAVLYFDASLYGVLYVCPDALSLSDVSLECSNGFEYEAEESEGYYFVEFDELYGGAMFVEKEEPVLTVGPYEIPSQDNLILYSALDEEEALDSSSNLYEADVNGADLDESLAVSGNSFSFSSGDGISYGDIEMDSYSALTISAMIKTDSSGKLRIVSKDKVGTPGNFILYIENGNVKFYVRDLSTNSWRSVSSGVGFNDGDWHHVVAVFDGESSEIQLYVDGTLVDSSSIYSSVLDDRDNEELVIGGDSSSSSHSESFVGNIDEVMIFDVAFDSFDVESLASIFSLESDSSEETDSSSEEESSEIDSSEEETETEETESSTVIDVDLILDVSFDDSLASDASSNAYSADIDGASLDSSSFVSGSSFSFTSNQGVSYGDIEMDDYSSLSVSAWISSTSSGKIRIVSKDQQGTPGNFMLYLDNGKVYFYVRDQSAGTWRSVVSSSGFNDGDWHHVVAVFDGIDSQIHLYVDGSLIGSSTISSGTLDDRDNEELVIGGDSHVGSYAESFIGNIDEVKVYSSVLDSSSVNLLYTEFDSDSSSDSSEEETETEETESSSSLDVDLILDVSFDDSLASDASSNAYSADIDGASLDSSSFVSGSSFSFASTQGISYGDIEMDDETALTISTWVSTTSTSKGRIVSKDKVGTPGNFMLYTENGKVHLYVRDQSAGKWRSVVSGNGFNDGDWHHVVGVFDSTTSKIYLYVDNTLIGTSSFSSNTLDDRDNEELVIGGDSKVGDHTESFDGNIDEVKVYSSALDSFDVNLLYTEFDS